MHTFYILHEATATLKKKTQNDFKSVTRNVK